MRIRIFLELIKSASPRCHYGYTSKIKTNYKNIRPYSSIVSELKKALSGNDKRTLYWTSVDNPDQHNQRHESLFYTVPKNHFKQWLSKGLETHFYRSAKAFNEANIMIRKPALEVISCLSKVDKSFPLLKFILHGRNGCGKSTSLAHIIHYSGAKGWMIVHVPWAAFYNRYSCSEIQYSTHSKTMRVDQPLAAAQWLADFKLQNEALLKNLNVLVSDTYVWNKREQTIPNSPMLEMIDFGLTRVKYATDVMGVVLKELKLQCNAGKFKVLVAIDGYNAFYGDTLIKQEDNRARKHKAEELSIVHFFKKLIVPDWTNGAVVCTVDGNASYPAKPQSYLPIDLIGQQGFEDLDPFIPVHVDNYSEKEFFSCMQYFFDHKWFVNPYSQTEEGIKEIKSLSCMNPKELYNLGVWM
ncbi:hypothetical protein HELRODRAFT_170221 [Helobdella robusta]|uniref:Small ribosomal subunit protein mS29 n=1 Tax=Helobdella robusta TaxID=6412 RepID=T1F2S9_HELRO|nr:hypothetical protein HELRODRAFT_170221 [Helobdella robusta]ESO07686.1 hypothetical protein HELRODRAFT_170221 [Helobdella robusta]